MILSYCERAVSASPWAEPANTLSNLAFLVAAGLALRDLRRAPPARDTSVPVLLAGLAVTIGIGSTWFHMQPTPVARLADVLPIAIFCCAYLVWAMRALLGLGSLHVAAAAAGLALATGAVVRVACPSLVAGPPTHVVPCLNGSITYIPALLAVMVVAAMLGWRGLTAARWLGAASLAFVAALIARTLDFELCAATRLVSRPLGLHWLWHLLTATAVYFLLRAAIEHAGRHHNP